jgi:hypothetical protein
MYVLVLAAQSDPRVQSSLMRPLQPKYLPWTLGVLLGLAILTKLSALLIVPVVGVFLLWRAWRGGNWRLFWRDGIIVTFCVLVLNGWWFYRNWVLYGEILGTSTMAQVYGFVRSEPVSLTSLLIEWRGWWYSLWGVFGAFNVLPDQWVYDLLTTLVILSIGGGLRALWFRTRSATVTEDVNMAHRLVVLFVALTFIGNVVWSLRQHALQGRLALGAVAAMSTYVAAGVVFLGGKSRENLIASLVALVLFVVSLIVPILYIAPRYRPPRPMRVTDLPGDIVATTVIFDDEIELVGYSVSDDAILPGETMQVSLYWTTHEEMHSDYNLALNVHGRDMEHIAKLDTWPGGGLLPTGDWMPGAVYADNYSIPISKTASTPTLLWLDVSFWIDSLDERLLASSNGSAIGSLMLDAGRLLPVTMVKETPHIENGSTFVPGITLIGHTVLSQLEAETRFIIFWRAEHPVSGDWTVFVHMLNATGDIVAQADGPPLKGDWPTSAWDLGQTVRDPRHLDYSSALPPGDYSVVVGLYDPASGLRAASHGRDGSEHTDRAVQLLSVRVAE